MFCKILNCNLGDVVEATPIKRVLTLFLLMCSLLLTACNNSSIGVIGGDDGPTIIIVRKNGGIVKGNLEEHLEK